MAGVLLTNAYNHYLTTYASKEVTQTATNKKDDLRGIYRSIVKSNQTNPVTLLKQNDHAEEGAIDLKENARLLQRTLSTVSDVGQEKPLGSRAAFSSNSDIVDAVYIGDEENEPPTFSVKVEQMAQNQVNSGKMLPDGNVRMLPGNYAFNIRMSDQVYELQYTIKGGETNRDVQERLGRLINKANIGLQADVKEDGKGATSLNLSSKTTGLPPGKKSQFEITEESDSGYTGTVAYFGLDQTTQQATDARFKINGTVHTSSSNHFTVSRTYELNLNRVSKSDEEAVIGVKTEQESLVDHVRSLTDGYNRFMDSIRGIGNDKFRSGKIMTEAMRVAKDTLPAETAAPLGLRLGDDGKLILNEEKFREATDIPDEELDEKMQPVRDFAKSLYSMASRVSIDPMRYIERPVVAYKNPEHVAAPNPYITSEYSGMLFNNYC